MNERITELAIQAEIKFESHPQHQGVDTAVIITADLQKFAELIVRECMEIVGDGTLDGEVYHDRIKQHFGVKE